MKIKKLKLLNFKKFPFLEIDFNDNHNVIIGDNESGKSSILLAIDLAISGSRNKIETLGLDHLFHNTAVETAMDTNTYNSLPKLEIELFFDDLEDADFYGRINSARHDHYGIRMVCEPRDELSKEISEILSSGYRNFPFEYYGIYFYTFSGQPYLGFKKYFKHIFLDNTSINTEYATNSYIKTLYNSSITFPEKSKHFNEYRKFKTTFKDSVLETLNNKTGEYQFAIKNNTKANLETDLTITEDNIEIQNRGKGRQCFIKTDFALSKTKNVLDFILLEEPENHLSHLNMKRLIQIISESDQKQIFIATHNNLISSRLDLRNTILLNNNSTTSLKLKNLNKSTSDFFMKAPDNNLLEFILSKKVILVEGDAEYILLEALFEKCKGNKPLDAGIHIISVGGTSFKRYLEIANLLNIRTAVLRDNDGDFQKKCIDNFEKHVSVNAQIFFDRDNTQSTFEISLYKSNSIICDNLFSAGRISRTIQQFMLDEKTECAFELLEKKASDLTVPDYIKQAITWITKD
jgi:predicted ATP-dependent endonuclease of OLD family